MSTLKEELGNWEGPAIRAKALECASRVCSGYTYPNVQFQIGPDQLAFNTIEVAKRFENYVKNGYY